MCLFFFTKKSLELSFLPFITATIGFWGSLVYYNSYLPEIASAGQQDKVSARGFSLGYFGSSILLIICLGIIMGIGKEFTRYSFLLVGVWWIGFAQYTISYLPRKDHKPHGPGKRKLIAKGFIELLCVFGQLRGLSLLKRFLAGYFFYNMGVQTVMVVAVLFARNEITWPNESAKTTSLIFSILIIQFVGIVGSFSFSRMSGLIGNIKSLMIAVLIWIFICVYTYAVATLPSHFYFVAFLVGFVMGGIQALSRSTYSKLLPPTEDHASFFSFYDVMEKIGMILGTVTFGIISETFGGMRTSILSLIVFFILGFIVLFGLRNTAANRPETLASGSGPS
jgi:UMF1 family MFS transporter